MVKYSSRSKTSTAEARALNAEEFIVHDEREA